MHLHRDVPLRRSRSALGNAVVFRRAHRLLRGEGGLFFLGVILIDALSSEALVNEDPRWQDLHGGDMTVARTPRACGYYY